MSGYSMSPRRPIVSLALASVVLIAAACGDDSMNPVEPKPKITRQVYGTPNVFALIHDASHTIVNEKSIPYQSAVHGMVHVKGEVAAPTGSVTVRWYFDSVCSSEPLMVATIPLDADGVVETAPEFAGTGIVSMEVEYSGDANYLGSTSICAWVNASGKAMPNITTALHNSAHQTIYEYPANVDLHPIANLTGTAGTPTGTLSFFSHGAGNCSGIPSSDMQSYVVAFGVADGVSSARAYTPGTYAVQAYYQGDNTYAKFIGPCLPFTVAAPTAALEIHNDAHQVVTQTGPWSVVHGKLTMSGKGVTPTGAVVFWLYTNGSCWGNPTAKQTVLDAMGAADDATASLTMAAGAGSMRAYYVGDANYASVTSNCATVDFAGGKLASATATEAHDNDHNVITTATVAVSVHGKATVTGPGVGPTPTGTITFYRFASANCTGTPYLTTKNRALDNAGINDDDWWINGEQVGTTYSIQAEYSGDQYYLGSVGSCAAYTRVVGIVPTIATEVHNEAHETVTTVFAATMTHPKGMVTGAVAVSWGFVEMEQFTNGTCTGEPAQWIMISTIGGVVDSPSFVHAAPPVGETWAYRVTYRGDATYDRTVGPCVTYTTVLQNAGVMLGSVGYWRNWRNHYSMPQFQLLIDYLKTNAAPVFNHDQAAGTADDLTVTKIDAIYDFPKKPSTTQQVLAHFTSLSMDLALTQIAQSAGLEQPNGVVCSAGTLELSGIAGAAALFGTSSPTIGQVVTFVASKWNGTLTANRAAWSFDLTSAQLNTVLAVLAKINDGSIIITTGC